VVRAEARLGAMDRLPAAASNASEAEGFAATIALRRALAERDVLCRVLDEAPALNGEPLVVYRGEGREILHGNRAFWTLAPAGLKRGDGLRAMGWPPLAKKRRSGSVKSILRGPSSHNFGSQYSQTNGQQIGGFQQQQQQNHQNHIPGQQNRMNHHQAHTSNNWRWEESFVGEIDGENWYYSVGRRSTIGDDEGIRAQAAMVSCADILAEREDILACCVDADGNVSYSNRTFASLMGVSDAATLIGIPAARLFAGKPEAACMLRAIAADTDTELRLVVDCGPSGTRMFEVHGRPFKTPPPTLSSSSSSSHNSKFPFASNCNGAVCASSVFAAMQNQYNLQPSPSSSFSSQSSSNFTAMECDEQPQDESAGRKSMSTTKNPIRFTFIGMEISDRMVLDRELTQGRLSVAETERVKSTFLSMITHELRTPLVSILGSMDVLLDTALSPKQATLVRSVARSGEHLIQMLGNIIDMTKLGTGDVQLTKEKISIADIFSELDYLVRYNAVDNDISVSLQIGRGVPSHIFGDKNRLVQVFFKVLDNAVKFSNPQGDVLINVSGVWHSDVATASGLDINKLETISVPVSQIMSIPEDREPSSTRKQPFHELVVQIQDFGVGIDTKHLARIFEPFEMADDSFSRTSSGTGLGLPVCKRLLDIMGGSVKVQSEVDHGSCFTVHLPLQLSEPFQLLQATTSHVPIAPSIWKLEQNASLSEKRTSFKNSSRTALSVEALQDTRVLLVEDTPLIQVIMTKFLESARMHVSLAKNGHEAVELFTKSDPGSFDIVLMDLQMPVMDGFTATQHIRAWEDENCAPRLPVLALTAFTLARELDACLEAGCDSYLIKPVKRDVLLEAIHSAVKAK